MAELPKPLDIPENLPSEQRVNILLVDDQPANLLALETVLQDLGHNLVKARSGEEALQRLLIEEFAIILPETNLEGARALADGLRERIEQSRFVFQGEIIRVTISIGGALLEDDKVSTDLIGRADEKLYAAKRAGRNRVLVE